MSDLISKKALMEALRSIQKYAPISLECAKTSLGDYFYDTDIVNLINSAPAVSGEAYGWVIDCKPEFIEVLNYEERNFFVEDKNQLSYYIGTEDEPSMYDITPLYLAPLQPQSVKDALEKAISKLFEMSLPHSSDAHIRGRCVEAIRKLIEDK